MKGRTFVDLDGKPFFWPGCAVPGCPNGACLNVPDNDKCFPHSGITHAQLDLFLRASGPLPLAEDDDGNPKDWEGR